MSIEEYASRFAELSRFASNYIAMDKIRMLRFEEGLMPYIRNQLAEQPIQTSQELYEHAAEIERVKTELRMTHQANPKKRWNEKSLQVEGVPSKNPTYFRPRIQRPTPTGKHGTKCGCTNHQYLRM